jgi:hypothetical protein
MNFGQFLHFSRIKSSGADVIPLIYYIVERSESFFRHARVADCVTIGKTTHIGVFVIPGLTRNPLFFQSFS